MWGSDNSGGQLEEEVGEPTVNRVSLTNVAQLPSSTRHEIITAWLEDNLFPYASIQLSYQTAAAAADPPNPDEPFRDLVMALETALPPIPGPPEGWLRFLQGSSLPPPPSPRPMTSPPHPISLPSEEFEHHDEQCFICLLHINIASRSTIALHDGMHYIHVECLVGIVSSSNRVEWNEPKFSFTCPTCRCRVSGSLMIHT